jgi:hypothetical protein
MEPFRALVPFARREQRTRGGHTACELCGAPVADGHEHVFEVAHRAIRCACTACAVLFRDPGAGGGRFRTIPDRVLELSPFSPSPGDWARLEVPVQLAFLVRGDGFTAFYPSPAGAVEAPLSERAAEALAELVPLSAGVERDIEALLLHRPRSGAARCFLVPVVACYELVDVVRRRWRGFDGGDEGRAAVEEFVARLGTVARRVTS